MGYPDKNYNVKELIQKTVNRVALGSSNINEVIKTVLNLFFYEKISHAQKKPKKA